MRSSSLDRRQADGAVWRVEAAWPGINSSMQVMETGLLDRHGIRRIGVAGHPEGSPDIPDRAVAAAIAWKNAFAERTDADLYAARSPADDSR